MSTMDEIREKSLAGHELMEDEQRVLIDADLKMLGGKSQRFSTTLIIWQNT
jgi:hypothetical protein